MRRTVGRLSDHAGSLRIDRPGPSFRIGPLDRFGWQVEASHVPGSFRMLGIWATSYAVGLSVSHAGQHVTAVGLITAGLVTGAVVLLRCDAPNREPMRESDNPTSSRRHRPQLGP